MHIAPFVINFRKGQFTYWGRFINFLHMVINLIIIYLQLVCNNNDKYKWNPVSILLSVTIIFLSIFEVFCLFASDKLLQGNPFCLFNLSAHFFTHVK